MPTTLPDLILLDAKAAATAGSGVGIGGASMRYGNVTNKPNQGRFPISFKVHVQLLDSTSGASATVAIQESADNVTFATMTGGTFTLSIPTGSNNDASALVFKSSARYIRANVTALAGGSAPTVSSYMTLGSLGQ